MKGIYNIADKYRATIYVIFIFTFDMFQEGKTITKAKQEFCHPAMIDRQIGSCKGILKTLSTLSSL